MFIYQQQQNKQIERLAFLIRIYDEFTKDRKSDLALDRYSQSYRDVMAQLTGTGDRS